jgi:hypothetical protein
MANTLIDTRVARRHVRSRLVAPSVCSSHDRCQIVHRFDRAMSKRQSTQHREAPRRNASFSAPKAGAQNEDAWHCDGVRRVVVDHSGIGMSPVFAMGIGVML